MDQCTRNGDPKILPESTLPLTDVGVVNRTITDLAAFDVTPDGLVQAADDIGDDELRAKTGAPFRRA